MEHQGFQNGAFSLCPCILIDIIRGFLHIVQKVIGLRLCLDLAAPDCSRKQSPDRQFPRTAVVIRHPFPDFQQGFGQRRMLRADRKHLLEIVAVRGGTDRHDVSLPFAVAAPERNVDAHPGFDLSAEMLRYPVIEAPVERKVQEHAGDIGQIFHNSAENRLSFI